MKKRKNVWLWKGCLSTALILSVFMTGCTKKTEVVSPTAKAGATEVPASADSGSTASSVYDSQEEDDQDYEKTITILQTSDIHGFLNAHDYASDSPVSYGLSKDASLIRRERQQNPNLLLIDTGDSSQGNMIEDFRGEPIPGAATGINALDYDAFILGNHDFNYEFDALNNMIDRMNAEVLSANIRKEDGSYFVKPYLIKEVDGVRVAVIGFTTPLVPVWESSNPDHYDHMVFTDPLSEMETLLDEVEPKADLIILAAHDSRNPEQGTSGFYAVADRFGNRIDAIFTGHEHAEYIEERSGVLMAGSGSHGKFLMKAEFRLTGQDGSYIITDRNAELLSTQEVKPDAEFMAATASIHDQCVTKANAIIGTIDKDFLENPEFLPGIPIVTQEDTALMDLVNQVQLHYTNADISMTNGFDPYANLTAGPFLYKDAVGLYPFDNTVKVIKVTGGSSERTDGEPGRGLFPPMETRGRDDQRRSQRTFYRI